MNKVQAYKILKKISLSKRCYSLMRENLSLVHMYSLLPRELQNHEEYLFRLLQKNKSLNFIGFKEIKDSLKFNMSSKKLYRFYSKFNFKTIEYVYNLASSIDTSWIKYYKVKDTDSFLKYLHLIYQRQDVNVCSWGEKEVFKGEKYSFFKIKNSEDIIYWSLSLDNCLDTYLKNRKINFFDMNSRKIVPLTYECSLKKNIITLYGVKKNNKPFALIELIDKKQYISQCKGRKNRELDVKNQHNMIVCLEKFLKKELSFITPVTPDEVNKYKK